VINVAILGVDSSHTNCFGDLIQNNNLFNKKMSLACIWGEDYQQALQKAQEIGCPKVAKSYNEAIECSDAIMVLGRFSESHLEPGLAAIRSKKPTFIDKPLVDSFLHAKKLRDESLVYGTPIMSCSIYRLSRAVQECKEFIAGRKVLGAYLTGPRYCLDLGDDPRFRDIFFYGVHLVEIFLAIFGANCIPEGKVVRDDYLLGHIECGNAFMTHLNFLSRLQTEFYHVHIVTESGILDREIRYEEDLYEKVLDVVFNFFKTGNEIFQIEETVKGIELLDFLKL